jgi:hypothetical protein
MGRLSRASTDWCRIRVVRVISGMVIAKRKLGWSNEMVSTVCLGTMTMGVQVNEVRTSIILMPNVFDSHSE